MAKMENLSIVENKMFTFLRSAFKLNRKALKQAFEKLLIAITPFEKNIKEARTFMYLDITSWLQSKIDNVAVEKIIQQKFKAINK